MLKESSLVNIRSCMYGLCLIIFLASSCSSPEFCPEHEMRLICNEASFIGTWEFVGYESDIDEEACLSSLEIEPDPSKDIIIQKSENPSKGDLVVNRIYLELQTHPDCSASDAYSGFSSILFNEEFTLNNSNHLSVCSRFIFAPIHKIYRRKE